MDRGFSIFHTGKEGERPPEKMTVSLVMKNNNANFMLRVSFAKHLFAKPQLNNANHNYALPWLSCAVKCCALATRFEAAHRFAFAVHRNSVAVRLRAARFVALPLLRNAASRRASPLLSRSVRLQAAPLQAELSQSLDPFPVDLCPFIAHRVHLLEISCASHGL